MEHPLLKADRVYSVIPDAKISLYEVPDRKIRVFASTLWEYLRAAGERRSDSSWQSLVRLLKTYFFNLRAVPVPTNLPAIRPSGMIAQLEKEVERCERIYPDLQREAENLLRYTRQLCSEEYNPLLDAVEELCGGDCKTRTALLLKEKRHVSVVEEVLQRGLAFGSSETGEVHKEAADLLNSGPPVTLGVEVTTPGELTTVDYFDTILFVGRPQWFGDSLFYVPRARNSHVVTFTWCNDSIELNPTFHSQVSRSGFLPSTSRETIGRLSSEKSDSELPAIDDLEPEIDWERIISAGLSRGDATQEERELEARLCLLEDDHAVFIPAGEHSVLTLDLEDREHPSTEYIEATELQPGDYVLLRTEGGGDMIATVANALLGEHAERVRNQQQQWKKRLEEWVAQEGAFAIAVKLLDLGAELANEGNVRNWISSDRIHPAEYADFAAIMKLIRLEHKTDEYWEAMKMIENAHRRAGHHIRQKLLKQVSEANVKRLLRTGRMDFEMSDDGGGKLTAFQVVDIASEIVSVPYYRVNQPFKAV